MAKEIRIKLKDPDKLEFELLEDAKVGDYINLNTAYDKASLDDLKSILQNKKAELISEWKKENEKEIFQNGINYFKASATFQKLNEDNIKFQNEIETLKKNQEKQKEIDAIKAVEAFKDSKEYKTLKEELISKQNEVIKLEEENKNKVALFKNSQEYLDLLKKSEENKDLINQINDLNKNKELEVKNAILNSKDKVIKEFKESQEYLDLIKKIKIQDEDLIKKQKEIAVLNNDVNNAVLKYKDSNEFKDLLKQNEKNKELNIELQNLSKDKAKEIEIAILKSKDLAIKEYKNSDEYLNLVNENKTQAKELSKISNDNLILKNENEELKNQRNLKSNKLIGEDLENWLSQQYQEDLESVLEDSIWQKTNVVHDGTKPDFIFKVKSNLEYITDENDPLYYLGKVVIEAKSERYDSSNKTKNKEFLPKLKKDMDNLGGDYALLVTELESNDIFSIKTSREFPNIFIVRPEWTMSLLKILRYIFLRKKALFKQEWTFKEKNDILNEFEDFKNSILENAFKNINKHLESIKTDADKIIKSAENILESQKIIVDKHMNAIENKINNFKIENKVVKKIAKLNSSKHETNEEELTLVNQLDHKEE
ncbi:MAG: DUF2130 domain-containing protein [Mycoplasmataceae bacterium]|nr:DUF2130 domain-containing protein [Mycoplasmataceae bacterium]